MIAPNWEPWTLLAAAFFAGLVDAVAGGGGLIQVPALFAALSAEAPATIFGTNKCSSVCGTVYAAWRYGRCIELPWLIAAPAAAIAFVFSFGGAAAVTLLPKELLRPLILVLLVVVTVYTALRRDFGVAVSTTVPKPDFALLLVVGAVLGFYDGFFGPGMGSFVIFAFVRWFGLDFLRASAAAKIVNASTNLAALTFFGPSGHVLWGLALAMALFNIAGAQAGAQLAIRGGSGFVRRAFLFASAVLIVKFGYDTLASMVK